MGSGLIVFGCREVTTIPSHGGMLCKELHHSKDFVVIPLGILVFSTSFTHTKYVSSRDDKQDSSVDDFMSMLPVGCGLS